MDVKADITLLNKYVPKKSEELNLIINKKLNEFNNNLSKFVTKEDFVTVVSKKVIIILIIFLFFIQLLLLL